MVHLWTSNSLLALNISPTASRACSDFHQCTKGCIHHWGKPESFQGRLLLPNALWGLCLSTFPAVSPQTNADLSSVKRWYVLGRFSKEKGRAWLHLGISCSSLCNTGPMSLHLWVCFQLLSCFTRDHGVLAAVTLFPVLTWGHMTKKMQLNRTAEHIGCHFLYFAHPADTSTALGVRKAEEYEKRNRSCSLVWQLTCTLCIWQENCCCWLALRGLGCNYSLDTKGGLEAII